MRYIMYTLYYVQAITCIYYITYTLHNILYAVSGSCLPLLGHVHVLAQDVVACQYGRFSCLHCKQDLLHSTSCVKFIAQVYQNGLGVMQI